MVCLTGSIYFLWPGFKSLGTLVVLWLENDVSLSAQRLHTKKSVTNARRQTLTWLVFPSNFMDCVQIMSTSKFYIIMLVKSWDLISDGELLNYCLDWRPFSCVSDLCHFFPPEHWKEETEAKLTWLWCVQRRWWVWRQTNSFE